jgi:hypothetical protein
MTGSSLKSSSGCAGHRWRFPVQRAPGQLQRQRSLAQRCVHRAARSASATAVEPIGVGIFQVVRQIGRISSAARGARCSRAPNNVRTIRRCALVPPNCRAREAHAPGAEARGGTRSRADHAAADHDCRTVPLGVSYRAALPGCRSSRASGSGARIATGEQRTPVTAITTSAARRGMLTMPASRI